MYLSVFGNESEEGSSKEVDLSDVGSLVRSLKENIDKLSDDLTRRDGIITGLNKSMVAIKRNLNFESGHIIVKGIKLLI